jgi:hypothetical protein
MFAISSNENSSMTNNIVTSGEKPSTVTKSDRRNHNMGSKHRSKKPSSTVDESSSYVRTPEPSPPVV